MSRATLIGLLICSQISYANLHDPTRPADYSGEQIDTPYSSSALDLSLTLVSSDKKAAVINGLYLKVGDKIGSKQIIAIDSNSVQLTDSNGTITLFLLDTAVKRAIKRDF
jgi:hypothetical protein